MSCWIRGCITKGGKYEKKKSLFTARTENMLNNWRASGIAAKGINEFNKKSRICELHFQKDDILQEDIFHMADGTSITVQRKVPKLKEDAVPCFFPPNLPPKNSYYRLNLINDEEKEQIRETNIRAQLESTVNCSVSSVPTKEPNNYISHHKQNSAANGDNELQTWTEMKKNLKSFTLSEYWISVITDEMAMWANWKEDWSSCIWRVVLEKNMTLRVCIGEREIESLGGKIKSIEDIQNIFQKLSNVNPCKGVGSKTCAKLCIGYVTKNLLCGMQRQRCISCMNNYKNELKKLKRLTPLKRLSNNSQSFRVEKVWLLKMSNVKTFCKKI